MARGATDAALAAAEAFLDRTVTVPINVTASTGQWSYAPPALGIVNSTAAVTIKAAAGAGVRNVITSMQIAAGALGVDTEIVVRDGADGTVLWRRPVTTAGVSQTVTLPTPILGSENTLLEIATLTATVTGGVYINVQGYTQ